MSMTVNGEIVVERTTEWAVRTSDNEIILADNEDDARGVVSSANVMDLGYSVLRRTVYAGVWEAD